MKPIKVKELIAGLKLLDPNACVALSTDSEGNNYSLMANERYLTSKCYLRNELGGQEPYFEESEFKKKGDEIEDFCGKKHSKKDLIKCIILWPTN